MRKSAQVFLDCLALGNRVVRQERLAQRQRHRASSGNFDRVLERFRDISEQLSHFLGRAKVLLIRVGADSSRVIQGPPVTDTDPGLMGLKLSRLQKTDIIGCYHRALVFGRQRHGCVEIIFLARPPCSL